jgi:alanine racemase
MANPIRKPRTRAHFASQIAAEWPVEAPVRADAYLTGFLRAILKAQDSATRDLAVANFRGELRTRRLNVADIAIIVRPLVN